MAPLTHVTQIDFAASVLASTLPVVVDFTAAWCAPCHRLTPVMEQLAAEYAGQVKIVQVDTDAEPQLAAQCGIQGMPTIMVFNAGHEVERVLGLRPRSTYVAMLDRLASQG